ncbi:MAG: peptidylprolyl isomerase [Cycloclasticus sp.]|nr:MAG: peptidylprolyl isomerase [Cycloclasticus sp.]
MLDKLRTHVKGWLGIVILVMISIPFALFGLQNYSSGGSEAPVAEVGDYKIYQADVNNAYQERVKELKEQYADQYSPDLFNEEAVRNESLNRLVQERLILHTVGEDGYAVSEKSILDVISTLDAFQKNGQFNKESYTRLLQARGMTTEGFVHQISVGLTRDQFISSIVDTTLVDDSEIDDFYRLNNQTRDIAYLSLPISSVLEDIVASDEEVEKNYTQNEHLYKTPAKASIEYVELNLDELMLDVKPTEEELMAFYEGEKQSFTEVGRRRASHILFDAPDGTSETESETKRAEAEAVLKRIRAGERFSELASTYSDDIGSAKSGGDLGIITEGMMDKKFEEALSSLQAGETSEVIQTSYGFQIIKLTEMDEAKVQPYSTVKAKVEERFKKNVARENFYQLSERFAELSFENPDSLESVVSELGLVIKKQSEVTGSTEMGIAAEDKVRHIIFSEDVLAGNNSEVIELSPEKMLVLRVTDYKSAETTPLDDVKGDVILAVKTNKAGEILDQKADEILANIQPHQTIKEFAVAGNVEFVDVGPMTRNDKSVAGALIRDAFSMSHPKEDQPSLKKSIAANGDVAIIQLSKVTDGDKSDITQASRDSFKKFLARLKGEVTLAASLANLSVGADVVFAKKPE